MSNDGSGVLRDLQNGRLDDQWSCGSLRAALARLPGGGDAPYAGRALILVQPTTRACDDAFAAVNADGTAAVNVRQALGKPSFVGPSQDGRCWVYVWPKNRDATIVSRFCFAKGKVLYVQISQ